MSEPQETTVVKKWYFDHYPDHRNDDRKTDKRSWVQLRDVEEGMGGLAVEIYLREKRVMTISGELDQWGTWISVGGLTEGEAEVSFVIAQEWSTKSFIKAYLAALTEFAKICDLEGKTDRQTPDYEEVTVPSPIV